MLQPMLQKVRDTLGGAIYGVDVSSLEEAVSALLREQGKTLSAAESCTGGLVAKRMTDLPGASAVFRGGVVSYTNEVKERVLGVPHELLEQHGAVSEPVARAMAQGCRALCGSDIAVSVTGVAGPDKDERGNDVGLAFIGLATAEGTFCKQIDLSRGRSQGMRRHLAAHHAFDMVRRALLGMEP